MPRILTPILLALSLAAPALGAAVRLHLDPEDTEIAFVLKATGHEVRGTFHLEAGELSLDPRTGAASGHLILDARSAQTGNKGRDKNMHKKVLESETYPQVRFEVQGVEGSLPESGAGVVRVRGTLSIHGGTHAVTLPVQLRIAGDRFTASTELEIPYVEWGMKDPSVIFLRVAKTVQVSAKAGGRITTAAPAEGEGAG